MAWSQWRSSVTQAAQRVARGTEAWIQAQGAAKRAEQQRRTEEANGNSMNQPTIPSTSPKIPSGGDGDCALPYMAIGDRSEPCATGDCFVFPIAERPDARSRTRPSCGIVPAVG
ncbi:hypothetical protein FJT64_016085 [Amphibalanus amphitrite]|uniref:Uncharacterized protein n=1 Tax=Amphibalanus amphitrite TaxID=1232801 RepID=A0A6A4X510_AMPAM|nr:hypothetical protein FJT64_016085 [Amphibalanus amphitrite]